ncbi:MAG: Hpt domain-containing protein [Lachnospiraceae bacterium]|nr:Hpt domain-containing protein [Lachnospiraceae bacterium]
MLTVDKLKAFGANTEEGLARCMNNEQFYLRVVGMGLEDKSFEELRAALDAGDLDTAFEKAHALKGVLGNLSLTPIYEPVQKMTELLRARTQMDYTGLLEEAVGLRDKLQAMSQED